MTILIDKTLLNKPLTILNFLFDNMIYFLGMEMVGTKWRAAITVLYQIPYSLGHMSLAGIAYYFRHWQHLQLAISLPSVILLGYWWIVPESPRWLLAVGKQKRACEILKRAAKVNKTEAKDIAEMVRKHCLHQVSSSIFFKFISFLQLYLFIFYLHLFMFFKYRIQEEQNLIMLRQYLIFLEHQI